QNPERPSADTRSIPAGERSSAPCRAARDPEGAMTPSCGTSPRCATLCPHLVGKQEVREGIQARFDGIPDIRYGDERHWTCGHRGVSEWTIRGTQLDGESIEVRGCDLFEFNGDKISRKDSFWKM